MFKNFISKFKKNTKNNEYRNSSDELIYIHIGKCGGSSLLDSINRSEILNNKFSTITHVHIKKPPILTNSNYLIVIRNPILRALSAFNWWYKLVVVDQVQKNRFKGEYQVLFKYQTLNLLAESLYTNGVLNKSVAKDFKKIHHLKEDISFYLTDLLNQIEDKQIYAVLRTEYLDADIKRYLGVQEIKKIHQNKENVHKDMLFLSDLARKNLKTFLCEDYKALTKLLSLINVSIEENSVILNWENI